LLLVSKKNIPDNFTYKNKIEKNIDSCEENKDFINYNQKSSLNPLLLALIFFVFMDKLSK